MTQEAELEERESALAAWAQDLEQAQLSLAGWAQELEQYRDVLVAAAEEMGRPLTFYGVSFDIPTFG